ncbi:hypothetical protein B4O97_18650 [Marispirochaeta aestuarii]|uniref:Uncharacterized protein n=1 Tax=Marispirochaeta aestuarii TaxID=1963862 RepID=A0A1Y1RT24_9SPIO|nr:hypothetical protein B4O97_18650 [Marispirochaeta aestuarii]
MVVLGIPESCLVSLRLRLFPYVRESNFRNSFNFILALGMKYSSSVVTIIIGSSSFLIEDFLIRQFRKIGKSVRFGPANTLIAIINCWVSIYHVRIVKYLYIA